MPVLADRAARAMRGEDPEAVVWGILLILVLAFLAKALNDQPKRGYVKRAMARAIYEQMENGDWYGEIPGFQGVWADTRSREAVQAELREVLEEWINLRRAKGLSLPALDEPGNVAA